MKIFCMCVPELRGQTTRTRGNGNRGASCRGRLAFVLHCLDERRCEHAARQLDDIGRMIGGWKKQAAECAARTVPGEAETV